ncbi:MULTISPECIES: methyl-accepting chemotaxis protein [unclassified Paenibacillus]|uniref:methyl-accepting chemotaxis protein n=1 Tax=unclassified Paenibacillus TaxID=185978 RepID=UPI001C121DB8|nr:MULTISPECIES: methyl-accepting chemotaxis protein [unclassified Paenibacillus]MBU5442889.1 methyl-accepting chemotaxis protein [Paenibacillus sp. MSJ-34]CAH0119199.1 Methyl-accepting chemotaxis protein McpA [Paenibacillus sp. CECT 9249]
MKFKFGIMKKIVLGITTVSIITYGTSAFFIFVLMRSFAHLMPQWLFILLTLSLGVFWTGFLGWIAAKWFIRPLLQLTDAANRASAGNLQVEIVPSRSDDELRALCLSFNAMIANLRHMIVEISTNYRVTDTRMNELKTSIHQATAHVQLIASTVEQMSDGAERQSQSSRNMFGSVERMTEAAEEIHRKISETTALTDQMANAIDSNASTIQSLVGGMGKLAASSRESIDVVRDLEHNANEISEISSVVGEFATQTNLLALNASIEAARAGEHGRGFAVVAGEVKKLAEQSALAVDNINQIIDQMQIKVGNTVQKITEQMELAEKEHTHGEAAERALTLMTEQANQVAQAVTDISAMISVQTEQVRSTLAEARSVSDIAALINAGALEVFASTQEQNSIMEGISGASDQLWEQSANLKKRIETFHVG